MDIYSKISKVMEDIKYLSKDDKVEFGNTKYKAISEEKVTSAVRESLITNGIVIIPIAQSHRREGTLSTVDVTYRIQNIEDKEDYVLAVSSGTGADTQDKGVGKAMTYAYKYLLLRTFAIPTGDDPDKISSAELDEKEQAEKKKAEEKKQQNDKPIICPNCKKPVKDYIDPQTGKVLLTAAHMAARNNKKYGVPICADCAKIKAAENDS